MSVQNKMAPTFSAILQDLTFVGNIDGNLWQDMEGT